MATTITVSHRATVPASERKRLYAEARRAAARERITPQARFEAARVDAIYTDSHALARYQAGHRVPAEMAVITDLYFR